MRPIPDQDQHDQLHSSIAKIADVSCLQTTYGTNRVILNNKLFSFDHVFGPSTPQREIYATLVQDLVPRFIEGHNATVLTFGQASSGKSFTMGLAQQTDGLGEQADGIIPRVMMELFEALQQQQSFNNAPLFTTSPAACKVTPSSSNKRNSAPHRLSNIPTGGTPKFSNQSSILKCTVKVSFLKVYSEELVDLLNEAPITEQPPITIHEDTNGQIHWKGAKQVTVNNIDDVLLYLAKGAKSRITTSATDVNRKSTHSQSIFSVTFQQEKWVPSSRSASYQRQHQRVCYPKLKQSHNDQSHYGGEWQVKTSKFHFVDFAGGVYSSRTDSEGNQVKDSTGIDPGLQALGNVLSALGDTSASGTPIPYRDSTLTRLLQDSLGGGATTVMIACASPLKQDLPETLNILRYIPCARNIKNSSGKNGVRPRKKSDNLDINTNTSGTSSPSTEGTPKHCLTAHGRSGTENKDTIEQPNTHDQQSLITDLQQQIEKLNGKVNASEEHNKSVENELLHFKNLYQRSSGSQQLYMMFGYLVEPVAEVYERCISNLETENCVLRAAVNYANTAIDELQLKCNSLQQTVDQQQDTMTGLYGQLTTMIERHHKIATFLDGLKTKLMTVESLQNGGAIKWQQIAGKIDYHTCNVEQILDDHRRQPQPTMCYTDSTTTETPKQQNTVEQQQQLSKEMVALARHGSQQLSISHELEKLKEKYKQLEEDRNKWKTQAEMHPTPLDRLVETTTTNSKTGSLQHRNYHTNSHSVIMQQSTTTRTNNNKRSKTTSRLTLNTSTPDSQSSSCVSISKFQTAQLGTKYTQAINELDGVLQHYFEMMEHAEHLEHISIMETTQPSTTTNSVTNNVSLLLSLACNSDTFESETDTTTSSIVDECISELAVFSPSSTGF